jgi:uncharacterized membrane protein YcgQ (UPF0703/DUF1980 family)
MAHAHHHADDDTYYVNQLCLIGVCAAFAGVCLTLYFSNPEMLRRILAPQFDPFVLFSGVALLVLVVIRSVVLWREAGGRAHSHGHHHHDHPHDHDHAHGHEHPHDHDHAHAEHVTAAPGHTHAPLPPSGQPHRHDHEHGHDPEHDHGWAPWRYVVLMVPIMLYLLGLPSQGKSVQAVALDKHEAADREFAGWATVVTLGQPLQQATAAAVVLPPQGRVYDVDFKSVYMLAFDPERQQEWAGRNVRVVAQFAPGLATDRYFTLARFRIQCCGADAVQLSVPVLLARGALQNIKDQPRRNDWVEVTGRVEFRQLPGSRDPVTVLVASGPEGVRTTRPDPDPYIR